MRRILILMSDTGGGHRAVAQALDYALRARHGSECQVDLVDGFREGSPFPFSRFPDIYPTWIRRSRSTYQLLAFALTDSRLGTRIVEQALYETMLKRRARRLFEDHPVDAVVCVHPWFVRLASRALGDRPDRPALVAVSTELASAHSSWYSPAMDLTCVASRAGYEKARSAGLPAARLRLTGFVVHPRFSEALPTRAEARQTLGVDPRLPTVLVVGGGEGMGAIDRIVEEIDALQLGCQLLVVAGRNAALRQLLESRGWRTPIRIYPFVGNMPTMMAASDVLVSKAGANAVAEACVVGLPVILYDAIPSQETPNVEIVERAGAGVYAGTPPSAAAALSQWLAAGPQLLRRMAANARRLAHPRAVWEVADMIWEWAGRRQVEPRNAAA